MPVADNECQFMKIDIDPERDAFWHWYWDLAKWNPGYSYADAQDHFYNQSIVYDEDPFKLNFTEICVRCKMPLCQGSYGVWLTGMTSDTSVCRRDGNIVYAHVPDRYANATET